MTELFEFKSISKNVDRREIMDMLPQWKTIVLEALYINQNTFPILQITFLIEANDVDNIKKWIHELEENTKTSYAIRNTAKSAGRYVEFKQRLVCHHSTRNKNVHDSKKTRHNTKNTNCPSKLNITLHGRIYHGKDNEKHELLKKMPCEIIYDVTHNHSVEMSLRYRKVSDEVKLQLLELYSSGHSPSTALESIKIDIQLNNDNSEELLADRKFCPTYLDCYALYMNEFKKILEFKENGKDFLLQKLESFNEKMQDGGNSARIIYHGTDDYAICICPPLFERVHQNIKESSELVFIDSTGTVGQDGHRLFILLTHSECGRLPLGILITSSEDHLILSKGLELLREMMGSDLFYGNCEGPVAFITDDSSMEHLALNIVWPKSKHFLCIFHVLQSIWRWLIHDKNNISKEKQVEFFNSFRNIMYSNTIEECDKNYALAISNAENCNNYIEYLKEYWKKRELWAKPFRNGLLLRGNHTNNYSEAAMRVKKEQIFEKIKAFNIFQMVDFISTKFIKYYERRLLDAANNRICKIFKEKNPVPPAGILEKIIIKDNIAQVPSEKENLYYTVNLEVNVCGCSEGNTSSYCKHLYWASMISTAAIHKSIISLHIRKIYYKIATGKCLKPLYANQRNEEQHFATASVITETDCAPLDDEHDYVKSEHLENNDVVYFDTIDNDEHDYYVMQEENTHESSDMDLYFDTIEKLQNCFKELLMKSPSEVGPNLLSMLETVEKINSPSTFVSYNFSYKKGSGKHINVQPKTSSERKILLSGKNVGSCHTKRS